MTTDVVLDGECFFIAPIGEKESETRKRSDNVEQHVVGPAAANLGLAVIRADRIEQPGQITRQLIDHVVGARTAVVDLTGANPNVYYEMAVRHTLRKPTVLIADVGETLPFDIAQMRVIFFDHRDLTSAHECSAFIERHLRHAMDGAVDSLVAVSVTVTELRHGDPEQQALANLVQQVETLSAALQERRRWEEEHMVRVRVPERPEEIRALRDDVDKLTKLWRERHMYDKDMGSVLASLTETLDGLGNPDYVELDGEARYVPRVNDAGDREWTHAWDEYRSRRIS